MTIRAHLPEDEYLRRIGSMAYLVASLEGLILFDLPCFGEVLPTQLSVGRLAGHTTKRLSDDLLRYAPQCTESAVADYLSAGGRALLEVAPQRNSVLHARPATDEEGRARLYRWRPPEAHFIDDLWLDCLIQRIDDLSCEVNALRPPLM